MKAISRDVWFFGAKRTPFGTFGGSLKEMSAPDMAIHASRAAIAQSRARYEDFDHVVFGTVLHTGSDAAFLPRHVGLGAGLSPRVPALGVSRGCGSGFEAIVQAAQLILTDQADLVLAGGTESMSQAPHLIRGARWGIPLGKGVLEDSLHDALTDSYNGMPLGLTAEHLAVRFELTQEEVDEYSVLTQRRFAAAKESGGLERELAPVVAPSRRGKQPFSRDEHNRQDTTREALSALPRVYKEGGLIHAGGACGLSDGAAAVVMGTRTYAERHGLSPLGRLLGWSHAGCDPDLMGLGPVYAIQNLLGRHQLSLAEIDLFEINEAFAAQVLAVERSLRLDRSRLNVDGGAIAVGHPLGATGVRLAMHLLYELERRGARYGIASTCIGGGQGIAVLVEAA